MNIADAKKIERTFEEGDLVLLKLQLYRQSSVAVQRWLKLAPKYYGPFEIEKKIRSIAYKLKLLTSFKIHHVFRVSMLKKYEGKGPNANSTLPIKYSQGQITVEPEMILQQRTIQSCGKPILQGLVKWVGLKETTWEDWTSLTRYFPHINFEDKVQLTKGRDVKTRKDTKGRNDCQVVRRRNKLNMRVLCPRRLFFVFASLQAVLFTLTRNASCPNRMYHIVFLIYQHI